MYGPPATLRCTHCGGMFAAPSPTSRSAAWFRCPHCGRPVPVAPAREAPPLYTWEVFPQLYPSLTLPRTVGPSLERTAAVLLLLVTVLLAIAAGGFLWQGASALGSHPYTVGGTVLANPANGSAAEPVGGARVNVSGENGFRASTFTDGSGRFVVRGVPAGGIAVNVTATGYAPLQLDLFANSVYSSPASSPSNLTLTTQAGGLDQGTTLVESPFPDLESFVATLWSGTTLLAVGALVAGTGLAMLVRRERAAWGVAGGSAGALAPAVLAELGVTGMFPPLTYLAVASSLAGIVAAALLALRLASVNDPEPPS